MSVLAPLNTSRLLLQNMMDVLYENNNGYCHGFAVTFISECLSQNCSIFDDQIQRVKELADQEHQDFRSVARKLDRASLDFFHMIHLIQNADQKDCFVPFGEQKKLVSQWSFETAEELSQIFGLAPKKGGIAEVAKFCGVYSQGDLISFFEELRKTAKSLSLNTPIAFHISGPDHSVAVIYDKDQWLFSECGKVIRDIEDAHDLVGILSTTFQKYQGSYPNPDKFIMLSISVCIGKDDALRTYKLFKKLFCSEVFKIIQEPDLQKASLKMSDNGDTLLHFASNYGHFKTVRSLVVEKKINMHVSNLKSLQAIHIAAQNGEDDILRLLLDAGADPNAVTDLGGTPLMSAAQNGHLEAVRILITHRNKADINLQDKEGFQAVHVAAEKGEDEILRLLLNSEADPNAVTEYGSTPLMSAVQEGHLEAARILITHRNKADINLQDKEGFQAIHMAALNGEDKILRLLLDAGADPNASRSDSGETPLMLAALNGSVNVARTLTTHRNKADIKCQDKKGFQAIHIAAQKGEKEILKLLLQAGADPNAVTKVGSTPLMLATSNGHLEVARILSKLRPLKKTKISRVKSYLLTLANRVWITVKKIFIRLKNTMITLKNRFF